jgi:aryl-alcohol dehydrogenase-like predicted oxidoreductase
METRTLGKTGLEVSVLGFGGAPVGYLATDTRDASVILNTLLDRGVNFIDTAASYSGSEDLIGAAIGHRRDDYVLLSKCGQAFDHIDGAAWSAQAIAQTVDRALRRLRTDHLDIMILHSCEIDILEAGDAMGALTAAQDAGKVRFVGYSGDNETAAFAAGLDAVSVIETSINFCDQANITTVLPQAERHNVGVIAKRPVANGAWKALSEQEGLYADYAKTYSERFARMALKAEDLGFDGNGTVVWPEIALRYTLSQSSVGTAIVGTTKLSHVEANISTAEIGPLDKAVIAELNHAFQQAEAASGEAWLGQR